MPDIVSKENRSKIMSKIRSKDTKLEIEFRKSVWKCGLRYRLHYKIAGKPDMVFPSKRVAVFIDSCFWHNCPKHCRKPKSNIDYWNSKLKKNAKRDREVNLLLKKQGWKVLRLWEHEIYKNLDSCLKRVINFL